jgi:hypothetical protein
MEGKKRGKGGEKRGKEEREKGRREGNRRLEIRYNYSRY